MKIVYYPLSLFFNSSFLIFYLIYYFIVEIIFNIPPRSGQEKTEPNQNTRNQNRSGTFKYLNGSYISIFK